MIWIGPSPISSVVSNWNPAGSQRHLRLSGGSSRGSLGGGVFLEGVILGTSCRPRGIGRPGDLY